MVVIACKLQVEKREKDSKGAEFLLGHPEDRHAHPLSSEPEDALGLSRALQNPPDSPGL